LGSSVGLNLEKMYNIKMFYDNDREDDVVWTTLAQVMNHNDNQISTSIKADNIFWLAERLLSP
jgi:peptide methionine sulfoxide reductase MsrA